MSDVYLERYQQMFEKYYLELTEQTFVKRYYINSVELKTRANGKTFYSVSFVVKTFDKGGTETESTEGSADLRDILQMFDMSNVEMKGRGE